MPGAMFLVWPKPTDWDASPVPRSLLVEAFFPRPVVTVTRGAGTTLPGDSNYLTENGFAYIVDGVPEIMKAARFNLRAGATQLKIMGGGGVASEFDPLHMTQFTLEEMKAAVQVAADYGTYCLVHAYHDDSVNRAIDAGVKCIEHNFLVSEDTIKRMKKEGIALSCQSIISLVTFANPEQITFFSPDQQAKGKRVNQGASQMFDWAMKYDLLMVLGGDMFGVADGPRQAENMIKMKRRRHVALPHPARCDVGCGHGDRVVCGDHESLQRW